MELNLIQTAIQLRQAANLPIVNLSFADFTFQSSLLTKNSIQRSFINIFKYPYYYPTAKGERESRQAVTNYYQELGQDVDPDSLLLTSSINQSYLYLLKIFSAEEGEILVPTPHSPSLDEVAGFLGLELKTFPLSAEDGWQIDPEVLAKHLTEKTRAIFLMSPHLPTGAIQTSETIHALSELLHQKPITLVVDESLSDFVFEKQKLPVISELVGSEQLVVSLQTLSNSFALPGFKVSWIQASGPDEEAQGFLHTVELMADTFLTLNQLSQAVLPEIIKFSKKWRHHFQKVIGKNQRILVGKLSKYPRLRFHHPAGGFYAFIEVLDDHGQSIHDENADQQTVVALLEKTGIYLHPGQYYGQKDGCYIMICFLQDPKILRLSLKKIARFFRSKKKIDTAK